MKFIDLLNCAIPELSAAYKNTAIATSVITVPLSLITTFGNLLVVVAITKNKRIQSQSNILLAGLCVTDLFVGLIGQPIYVARRVYELKLNFDSVYCTLVKIHIYFAYLGVGLSVTTMAFVSLDRWFAICRPFRYQELQSKTRYVVIIVTTFLLYSILMATPYAGLPSVAIYIGGSITVLISTIIIIVCYISIYTVILRHKRRITEQSVSQVQASNERSRRPAEKRKANTIAILLCILFICYCPHVSLICYKSFSGKKMAVASRWAETIIMMNSSINPVVYCLRSTEIRDAVKAIILNMFLRKTADSDLPPLNSRLRSKNSGTYLSKKSISKTVNNNNEPIATIT